MILRIIRTPDEDVPLPSHRGGPETERVAASLARLRAGTLRAKVLLSLHEAPGTQGEVAERLGAYHYSVAPRFIELRRAGWLRDSGQRRETERGAPAVVWELTESGHAMAERTAS